jgi:predicted ABC-type ATPase/GNAT superfamily N-acetyltransferase
MPVVIRRAGPADAAVVVEFNARLAEESEGKTLDPRQLEPGVAAVLADPVKGLYFLAERDGQIVGQIGLTFEYSDWRYGWFWWIQSVYVRPEARRGGVFRALYEHVRKLAEADPEVVGLRLYVEDGNKGAQETYFRLGMQRTGYFVLEEYPLEKGAVRFASAEPAAKPTVIVLAGSNGAGKTTAARTLLAEELRLLTFVNADVIAQGLAGFDPDTAALQAGRIMLTRLQELATARASFAFETTLAGRWYANWLKELRRQGYDVHLFYVWLASADLAVTRVAERVRLGGHDVPEAKVRQRYGRSVRNFFELYQPIATTWEVYNNTAMAPTYELIAYADNKGVEHVVRADLWAQMKQGRA